MMKNKIFSAKVKRAALMCGLLISLLPPGVSAQTATITVRSDQPGAAIPATLFGLFFEDINFAADGGLYPERVKNRSFEFPDPLMGWRRTDAALAQGAVTIANEDPINVGNSHYLRMAQEKAGGQLGIFNEGFRGIGIEKGADYTFSVYARSRKANSLTLNIELQDEVGRSLGKTSLQNFAPQWKKQTATLRANASELHSRLLLTLEGSGTLDLDMVSLFPQDTWQRRPNGLRADLVQLLKDMKPGFIRFPGGCIVEGRTLENRYQWKTTVGDLKDRRLIMNRWNTEYRTHSTPDYFQSFGLGFYEYFQLSEDVGAEPLPILNCGMACQFNSGELAPLDDLDEFIQDALDLIEFANGPVSTKWGRLRAGMGHPAPFNLKMIGVGNEQWGQQYIERYEKFAKVLKEKHPEIKLISGAGPSPDDERFKFAWTNLRTLKADLIDEHYYKPPKWFLENAGRYDGYERSGPHVFAGEYAAHAADRRNNWEAALAEAAFMTGLERNADLVRMASYAPLFGHVDAWQWKPDLIWFDNLRSYGTPSYYVQKVFSVNKGQTILPVLINNSQKNAQDNLYSSAALNPATGELILKIVNSAPSQRTVRIELNGSQNTGKSAHVIELSSADLKAENSLAEPTKVVPQEREFRISASNFDFPLAPNSLTVLRIPSTGK
jgi:alpha-N-arabinofuranosidase